MRHTHGRNDVIVTTFTGVTIEMRSVSYQPKPDLMHLLETKALSQLSKHSVHLTKHGVHDYSDRYRFYSMLIQ